MLAQVGRDRVVAAGQHLGRDVDSLIGVGHPALVDAEMLDDVAPGIFRHGHDMVGGAGQRGEQAIEVFLVVQGGVGQAQRHQIVDGVDVGAALERQRHGMRRMEDVGPVGQP